MTENAVLAAARSLVEAFGRHDTRAYFDAFTPDATFIFHTTAEFVGSRAEYERLWASWELEDGFRVLSCRSSNGRVRLVGDDGAVFSHDVQTTVSTGGAESTVRERETIVFQRYGGRWLAVHEHLSAAPGS